MSLVRSTDFFSDFVNNMNSTNYEPRANVYQTKNGMTLEIELPGFSRSDIDIDAANGTLSVTAKRSDTKHEYTRREFGATSVKRSWVIPRSIDSERIEASYDAGILTLDLPYKSGTSESRRKIEIR